MTRESSSGLYLLAVEITSRCNLRCRHCYGDFYDKDAISMDDAAISTIVSFVERMRIPNVTLTGGEPLLAGSRVFRWARELQDVGAAVTLTTNGLLAPKYPSNWFRVFSRVQLSIDGTREEHDRLRGSGTYARVLEALEHLKRGGLRQIVLMMTVHSGNVSSLLDVSSFATEQKVEFAIERYTGPSTGDLRMLTAEEFHGALEFCQTHKAHCLDPLMETVRHRHLPDFQIRHRGGCTAGIAALAITAGLDVLPCVRLRSPIGNLDVEDLEDLWEHSPALKRLRNRRSFESCGSCVHVAVCGGCRAAAFAVDGDFLGRDPGCWWPQ